MDKLFSSMFNFAKYNYRHKRIAICPFHKNGMLLKQILSEAFGVQNIMIIDNGLAKHNSSILSVQDLKNINTDDLVILINSTNEKTNSELVDEIQSVDSQIQIRNIFEPIYIEYAEKENCLRSIKDRLRVYRCVDKDLIRVGG